MDTQIHVVFLHNKSKTHYEDRYLFDMAYALLQEGNKVSLITSGMGQHNISEFSIHVVFLHNKSKTHYEDRYLLDMAYALLQDGNKVSLITSGMGQHNVSEFSDMESHLNVVYCGSWLPSNWNCLRAILMALRLLFYPPIPPPRIVVMDVHSVALYLLSLLSDFHLIFVPPFATQNSFSSKFTSYQFTRSIALSYADEIIVPSDSLAKVFNQIRPQLNQEILILYPCVDTGAWKEEKLDITWLVPNIPKPHFLFVTFGSFTKSSNLKLVLVAFERLLSMCEEYIRNKLHLIIGGTLPNSSNESRYYNELRQCAKHRNLESQVTFVHQVSIRHRKTLIEESLCVILPSRYQDDPFPETVLASMALSRPIIAVKNGFAEEVLRHRRTAILVEPQSNIFALAMLKILINRNVQVFIGEMGNAQFKKHYSFSAFKRKINGIVRQCAEVNVCPNTYFNQVHKTHIS